MCVEIEIELAGWIIFLGLEKYGGSEQLSYGYGHVWIKSNDRASGVVAKLLGVVVARKRQSHHVCPLW